MSSRDKGDRRERQAAEFYERAGYSVERATAGGFKSPDFFGEYDLIAILPGDGTLLSHGPEIRLVQVKANGARGVESWTERTVHHVGNDIQPEMAVCYDREGWRLIHPKSSGHKTVVDERGASGDMGDLLTEYLTDAAEGKVQHHE